MNVKHGKRKIYPEITVQYQLYQLSVIARNVHQDHFNKKITRPEGGLHPGLVIKVEVRTRTRDLALMRFARLPLVHGRVLSFTFTPLLR